MRLNRLSMEMVLAEQITEPPILDEGLPFQSTEEAQKKVVNQIRRLTHRAFRESKYEEAVKAQQRSDDSSAFNGKCFGYTLSK